MRCALGKPPVCNGASAFDPNAVVLDKQVKVDRGSYAQPRPLPQVLGCSMISVMVVILSQYSGALDAVSEA